MKSLGGTTSFESGDVEFLSYIPKRVCGIESDIKSEAKYFVHLRHERQKIGVSEKVYFEIRHLKNPS